MLAWRKFESSFSEKDFDLNWRPANQWSSGGAINFWIPISLCLPLFSSFCHCDLNWQLACCNQLLNFNFPDRNPPLWLPINVINMKSRWWQLDFKFHFQLCPIFSLACVSQVCGLEICDDRLSCKFLQNLCKNMKLIHFLRLHTHSLKIYWIFTYLFHFLRKRTKLIHTNI